MEAVGGGLVGRLRRDRVGGGGKDIDTGSRARDIPPETVKIEGWAFPWTCLFERREVGRHAVLRWLGGWDEPIIKSSQGQWRGKDEEREIGHLQRINTARATPNSSQVTG